MPVRIARKDLNTVQAIITDEGRRWVEQHVPGRAGSIFQELGRSAVRLQLEGLLVGETALETLETLRHAQAEARPVPFAADVTAGMDLTDVLIDSLQVRQVAGHRHRYWYRLQLREHVEEPPIPAAAQLAVDAGVELDAAAFAAGALDAASAMQDVTALPALMEANPSLLEHLSTGDLAGALDAAAAGLSGGDLDSILSAAGLDEGTLGALTQRLRNVQMADVIAAYNAIKDPSSLPKLLADNPSMLERLGVADLGRALTEKADALTGGQFSQVLQALGKADPAKVAGLIQELRSADNLGDFVQKLAEGGVDIVQALTGVDLGTVAILVKGMAGASDFLLKLQEVGKEASALGSTLRGFDPLGPLRALSGQDPGDAGHLSDIVSATHELVQSLDALLETETVEAALELVRQVGAQAQLNAAVDLLDGVLRQVDDLLEGAREPLRQVMALQGLLALTGSLVSGLERISSTAAEDLRAMGLGAAREAEPLVQALDLGRNVLDRGAQVLEAAPSVETVDALRESVGRVHGQLLDCKRVPRGGTV
jgi:hypothetical protein